MRNSILTDDVVWESVATGDTLEMRDSINGRRRFVDWLDAVTTGSTATHLTTNHLFKLDGDTAHSESGMLVLDVRTLVVAATGIVKADYRRLPEGWCIGRLRMEERVPDDAVVSMAGFLNLPTSKLKTEM